jgi:ABC-type lipoprotein release transport system permease subunit
MADLARMFMTSSLLLITRGSILGGAIGAVVCSSYTWVWNVTCLDVVLCTTH